MSPPIPMSAAFSVGNRVGGCRAGSGHHRLAPESEIDLCGFEHIEPKFAGPDDSPHLLRSSDTHDCGGYREIVQSPCNRDFPWSASIAIAYLPQQLHQTQVAGEQRFLKIGIPFSPVVWRECCNASPCHCAA